MKLDKDNFEEFYKLGKEFYVVKTNGIETARPLKFSVEDRAYNNENILYFMIGNKDFHESHEVHRFAINSKSCTFTDFHRGKCYTEREEANMHLRENYTREIARLNDYEFKSNPIQIITPELKDSIKTIVNRAYP